MADETESHLVIGAEPAVIMAVIADLPAYPEWSDGVRATEVLAEFDDGRPKAVRMTIASGPIRDTYEIEYDWHGDDSVHWWLTRGDVLKDLDGHYTLTPAPEGGTLVSYRLMVDLSIPLIGLIKRKAEKVIVDTALRGLKRRVEGLT